MDGSIQIIFNNHKLLDFLENTNITQLILTWQKQNKQIFCGVVTKVYRVYNNGVKNRNNDTDYQRERDASNDLVDCH